MLARKRRCGGDENCNIKLVRKRSCYFGAGFPSQSVCKNALCRTGLDALYMTCQQLSLSLLPAQDDQELNPHFTYCSNVKDSDVILVRTQRQLEDFGRGDSVLDLHRPLVHDEH